MIIVTTLCTATFMNLHKTDSVDMRLFVAVSADDTVAVVSVDQNQEDELSADDNLTSKSDESSVCSLAADLLTTWQSLKVCTGCLRIAAKHRTGESTPATEHQTTTLKYCQIYLVLSPLPLGSSPLNPARGSGGAL